MGFVDTIRDFFAHTFARRYDTMFGTAKVYEVSWGDTRIRVLDIDDTYQSATYIDESWCEVPFPYLALYEAVFEAEHPATSLCMLGGGGYAFPKQVIARHGEACIDVVEIDPAITRIAYEHFFVDKLEQVYHATQNGRLRTFNVDAIEHLRTCAQTGTRYDAILNDCFAGEASYSALVTPEAIELVQACLTQNGMYLTNAITALEGDDAKPLTHLVTLLSAEFNHIYALTCDRCDPDEKDNIIVVATNTNPHLKDAIHLYDKWE